MQLFLAQAVGITVGRRSGVQLAMMLVATIDDSIFLFFPPLSMFLIEEVLGSKKLFRKR